jgi:PAS domain S-box-containing protein
MESNNSQQIIKLQTNGTTAEFTRRKNWSQSILESLRDVIHVMSSSNLLLVYCSAASSEFLGYKPSELVGHAFTEFLHVDDVDMFVREFRTAMNHVQIFQCSYRFLRKDGKYTTLETRGHFHKGSLFGNARRIPTEAAQSMDSFLDLKIENELLKKKLIALKNQHKAQEYSIQNDQANSISTEEEYNDDISSNATNVYTQGVNSSYDINESLALFTGLRYDLGERSVGISLGLEGGELTNVSMDELLSYPTIVSNAESVAARKPSSDRSVKKVRSHMGSSYFCC